MVPNPRRRVLLPVDRVRDGHRALRHRGSFARDHSGQRTHMLRWPWVLVRRPIALRIRAPDQVDRTGQRHPGSADPIGGSRMTLDRSGLISIRCRSASHWPGGPAEGMPAACRWVATGHIGGERLRRGQQGAPGLGTATGPSVTEAHSLHSALTSANSWYSSSTVVASSIFLASSSSEKIMAIFERMPRCSSSTPAIPTTTRTSCPSQSMGLA